MSVTSTTAAMDLPIEEHRAVVAWRRLGKTDRPVARVEVLKHKKRKKSLVYRLHEAGPRGESIIAKRCRVQTGVREIRAYRDLIPSLGLEGLVLHGSVIIESDDRVWLFLEDAGNKEPDDHDLIEVARWLARMHARSIEWRDGSEVYPELGAAHFEAKLDSALSLHSNARHGGRFEGTALALLRDTEDLAAEIRGDGWPFLLNLVASCPRTILHGDAARKNIRVLRRGKNARLFLLDWECAAFGCPGYDLVTLNWSDSSSLDPPLRRAYSDTMDSELHGYRESEVESWILCGRFLRSLERLYINARSLEVGPKPWLMERMELALGHLKRAVAEAGW